MGYEKYGAGPYVLSYFFYVMWALGLAALAASLVRYGTLDIIIFLFLVMFVIT